MTLCNVRYDALQCTLLHICEIFTRRCSRSSSVAPLSQTFRPRRCPRQGLSMLPADDTRLGHTLQCERIAWGDEVFSTGCSVRFHREDYEGWNWKSRAEHNSATGVRTPAPPLGGAWVTFAWNGPHTGALLQRWICASDIALFVRFKRLSHQLFCRSSRSSCANPKTWSGTFHSTASTHTGGRCLTHHHATIKHTSLARSAIRLTLLSSPSPYRGFGSTPAHFTTCTHQLRQVTSEFVAVRL